MYYRSETLTELAKEVLAEHPELEANNAAIAFMESDKNKTKGKSSIVYADCHKIPEKEHVLSGYDFIITFYAGSMNMSDQALRILMYHELLHAGMAEDGKAYIVPHNLEDFREIIEQYGVDWELI